MKKLFTALALSVTLVAAATGALAETLTNNAAKVTIEVPKGWKVKKEAESVTMMDKAEDIAVAVIVIDAGDLKNAVKRLEKNLEKKVDKLHWDNDGKKVDINGMKGVMLDGGGKIDGKNVDIAVLLLDTPAKDKDLVILAIGDDDDIEEHADELKFIFKNLKPAD